MPFNLIKERILFMKKKMIVAFVMVLLMSAAIFFIVKVNKKYPQWKSEEYSTNSTIILDGYSVQVNSHKIMTLQEFIDAYGVEEKKTKAEEENQKDVIYVFLVQCTFEITGEVKGFPYADIRLSSGAFKQGISNDYIRQLNKDLNFAKMSNGSTVEVAIPFLIHSISFPNQISVDWLNRENWKLYFSVTPAKYVRLEK